MPEKKTESEAEQPSMLLACGLCSHSTTFPLSDPHVFDGMKEGEKWDSLAAEMKRRGGGWVVEADDAGKRFICCPACKINSEAMSSKEIRPFGAEGVCHKCGCTDIKRKYRNVPPFPNSEISDHFFTSCTSCGYGWYEQTRETPCLKKPNFLLRIFRRSKKS